MTERRRIFLHVGTPKTGTTYLQNLLQANRRRLARAGLHYPGSLLGQFEAALSLRGEDYQGSASRWSSSAWNRLVSRVRSLDGTVVISHELFGDADRSVADRAVRELSASGEVHLVLTARALNRQVPAVWQENLKNRDTISYGDFIAEVKDGPGAGPAADMFWLRQDLPAVLRRWAARIPRERVHVVTVPPPGAPPHVLWLRFASLLDIDVQVRPPRGAENASLGAAQAELLRRINERLAGQLSWPEYSRRLRRYLMPLLTDPALASGPLRLPQSAEQWACAESARMVGELRAAGWPVVGDLDDLLATADPTVTSDADPAARLQPAVEDVLQQAVDALAGVLVTDPGGAAGVGQELRHVGRGVLRRVHALRS